MKKSNVFASFMSIALSALIFSSSANSAETCLRLNGTYKLSEPCPFLASDGGFAWELPFLPSFDNLHVGDLINFQQSSCGELNYSFKTQMGKAVKGSFKTSILSPKSSVSASFNSSKIFVKYNEQAYINKNGTRESSWELSLDPQKKLQIVFSDLRILDKNLPKLASSSYFACKFNKN